MKRITVEEAKTKRVFTREQFNALSKQARQGPKYFTIEEGEDGFDDIKYYID